MYNNYHGIAGWQNVFRTEALPFSQCRLITRSHNTSTMCLSTSYFCLKFLVAADYQEITAGDNQCILSTSRYGEIFMVSNWTT